jgi:hypothetical protein
LPGQFDGQRSRIERQLAHGGSSSPFPFRSISHRPGFSIEEVPGRRAEMPTFTLFRYSAKGRAGRHGVRRFLRKYSGLEQTSEVSKTAEVCRTQIGSFLG